MTTQAIERPVCQQCGVCCLMGPCGLGESKDDRCLELRWKGDKAVCGLVADGKISLDHHMFNSGCVLRQNKAIFEWYRTHYKKG